jgi:Asp-tRNA(Asn)/Glu-tRNA(Gln) amidotransferase A subunit family amidase
MTHQLKDKIAQVQAELQEVVDQHNQALKVKNEKYNKFLELQGALKALKEVDHDDQHSEGNDT